ncbi:exosporium leader peptide-containing protein [Bacillus mycoides]|uniref:exosporium leader peptide-containing protein n=1 Tax=Bacillus mycoides TaxID=1405 RepID=UPI003464BC85
MDEFLSSAALNPGSVGPTLPPVPPFQFPTGPTGSTGATGPTGPTGTLSLAFGNFWQTQFITVPFEDPFSFNQVGPIAGGVSLLNPTTISITQAGFYRVSFIALINTSLNPVFPHLPIISAFLNNSPIPNVQASFGIQINDSEDSGCHQLSGEMILSIPANSILQLRNDSFFNSQNIVTCDNGVNAVELTIIKLN